MTQHIFKEAMDAQNPSQGLSGNGDAKTSDTARQAGKNSKGKGKEPSMVDKLWSSGQMLSGAMGSGAPTLAGIAASEKATGTQASGSGSSSNVFHETSQVGALPGGTARHADAFRSQREANASQTGFNEFLNGQELDISQSHTQRPNNTRVENSAGNSVADFQATDGAAVADLLSQPPDFETEPSQEDRDETIAPETAANLRKALFERSGQHLDWDHLLNFTPSFVSNPAENAMEARLHMGLEDPVVAREAWIEQWRSVLSSYNEEVWGDLGLLVEQAKRQIDNPVPGDDANVGQGALGRLKMILAHVRGSV